jgi:hypothetical protein
VFADAEGQTFRWGLALRQYFIDRDGNPVLTADGQPVHRLVDQQGQQVLDGEGRLLIGAVEIPPGCQIRTYHQRGVAAATLAPPASRSLPERTGCVAVI